MIFFLLFLSLPFFICLHFCFRAVCFNVRLYWCYKNVWKKQWMVKRKRTKTLERVWRREKCDTKLNFNGRKKYNRTTWNFCNVLHLSGFSYRSFFSENLAFTNDLLFGNENRMNDDRAMKNFHFVQASCTQYLSSLGRKIKSFWKGKKKKERRKSFIIHSEIYGISLHFSMELEKYGTLYIKRNYYKWIKRSITDFERCSLAPTFNAGTK